MRKIMLTGLATAALAMSLTACGGGSDNKTAAAPPASTNGTAPAPTGSSTPGGPDGTKAPEGTKAPGGTGGHHTPPSQPGSGGVHQISSKWGKLEYLAPGKFIVGNVAFFTATDTVLIVAGGKCPNGSAPTGNSRCSVEGIDEWAQASPHNVNVHFSGQLATRIVETQ
ncbi:hypothetical protein [Actinomadura rupiterrae]|uniref:hypothetical protein n=1 Tax=Actinomadura rupiterrae TaxID=559627 RepID=UPI0020A272A6|nr:hypothetical protein [Actinomadura rupiterrae]MCP2337816.1 transcription elongation factor [Actinomadura rupiterrae]